MRYNRDRHDIIMVGKHDISAGFDSQGMKRSSRIISVYSTVLSLFSIFINDAIDAL